MNPFPGVNPYIEAEWYWGDFHTHFLVELSLQLLDRLPGNYDARIKEQALLLTPDEKKIREPDISVTQSGTPYRGSEAKSVGGTAVANEPVLLEMLPLTLIEETLVWIEIIHREDDELITSIELLSPTNKDTRGREDFRAKRNALLRAGVHLVDLDLLLGGDRFEFREPLPPAHFYAFIARGQAKRMVEVHRWTLHDPLPTIPIPLRAPDKDATIDLQDVYQTTFDRARYPRRLEYGRPLVNVDAASQNWAAETAAKRPQ